MEKNKPEDSSLDLLTDSSYYELKEAYLKIKVQLSQTLHPEIREYQLKTNDLLP